MDLMGTLLYVFGSCERQSILRILSYLSRSLADSWGTTVDFTISFLHSSRFSAFRRKMFQSRPVHSLMVSPSLNEEADRRNNGKTTEETYRRDVRPFETDTKGSLSSSLTCLCTGQVTDTGRPTYLIHGR